MSYCLAYLSLLTSMVYGAVALPVRENNHLLCGPSTETHFVTAGNWSYTTHALNTLENSFNTSYHRFLYSDWIWPSKSLLPLIPHILNMLI